MSNIVSDQKIRNAVRKLAPRVAEHDTLLRGVIARIRTQGLLFQNGGLDLTEEGLEQGLLAISSELLGIELQLKSCG